MPQPEIAKPQDLAAAFIQFTYTREKEKFFAVRAEDVADYAIDPNQTQAAGEHLRNKGCGVEQCLYQGGLALVFRVFRIGL